MAGANYEVNIELKAGSALQALERIEGKINQLGKSSKNLADERNAAMVKVRDVGDQVRRLEEKGVSVAKARQQVNKASQAIEKGSLATANTRVQIAQREVKIIQSELALEKQITAEQKKQSTFSKRPGSGRISSAVSGAAIGGAFPFLFGQGGAASVGGALGGLGGIFGGQFGFAGSLIGTAIGQAIQEAEDFNRELASLNSTLTISGDVSLTTAQDIRELADGLGIAKEEAVELVGSFAQFRDGDVREELARIFGNVGGFETFDKIVKARLEEKNTLDAIVASVKIIGTEKAEELVTQLESNDALSVSVALQEAITEAAKQENVEREKTVGFMDRINSAFALLGATAVLRSGGPMVEDPLTAQGIAEARGEEAALAEFNSPVLNDAIERYENFLKKVKDLQEKYGAKPKRDRPGSSSRPRSLTAAETGESVERALNRQLARYEEIDPLARKIAMVEANHLTIVERIAEVKDESRRIDLTVLANKVREAQLATIIADEEERRARADKKRIETFNQRFFAAEAEGRILEADLQGRGEEQRLIETIAKQTKGLSATEAELVEDRLRANVALQQQVQEAEKLQQIYDGIGQSISSGIIDMLDAAFDRTKSLADAAGNLLRGLANDLLKLGVNTALKSTGLNIFSNLPGFANGGAISRGQPAIVGERGPELFVPGAQGNIVPNDAMGSANVTVNVDASGTQVQGDGPSASQLGRVIGAAVQSELIKQKRPGGLLAR